MYLRRGAEEPRGENERMNEMVECEMKKRWPVMIKDIGWRVVTADDIDGAYVAATKEYGCKIEDILAVAGGPLQCLDIVSSFR